MFSKALWKVQNQKALLCQAGVLVMALGGGLCTALQSLLMAKIVNQVFFLGQTLPTVLPLFYGLLGIILLRGLLQWGEEHLALQTAGLVKETLLQNLLEHSRRLGPAVMEHRRRGEFFTLLTQGLSTLDTYFCRYLPQLFKSALLPLTYLCLVFPIDWISGAIFLITTPMIPVFMMLIGKWSRKMAGSSWEAMSRMGGYLQDVLAGLATLRHWNREYRQEEKIRQVSEDFRLATMRTMSIAFLSALTLEMFTTISIALVSVGLGVRLAEGTAVFELALFLILLAPEYYLPLRQLGQQYHNSQNAILAADEMFAFLGHVPTAQSSPKQRRENALPPEVTLKDVSFQWTHRPVLQKVSLTLASGGVYAVAGRSGAGKTTLLRLLAGAISPSAGQMLVDGRPFCGWEGLALIPAQPYFFHGSVLENITLGREVPAHRVEAVCGEIGAEDFIRRLPQGYHTLLGQEGLRLSGGQGQLLSIARAMVCPCGLLLCDEATSSLDVQSEALVQKALDKLYENKTVLVSAHRLHTLTKAREIFVLEEGAVVQRGSYDCLVKEENGPFAQMLREGLAL